MLINDERLEEYLLSHIDPEPAELHSLYRYTHLHCPYPRMCAGHYQGRLLKMLTEMIRPSRVLEIGAFTGYSTLSIAEGLDVGGCIDTIEIDAEKEPLLRKVFGASGRSDRIRLLIGDALELIPGLDTKYDMVYIDGNKRHYDRYLEAVYPLVPPGGWILADNTLWDMKVVESAVNGSEDAQTAGLSRFNDMVAADTRFEKIILPVRDGLTILRRKIQEHYIGDERYNVK